MSPLTHALVRYWHELPCRPPVERLSALRSVRQAVTDAGRPAAHLVPFALGDTDPEVVREAVEAYLAAPRTSRLDPGSGSPLDEALEWIRRSLALNRAAVFAALLATGESTVLERLASLRLVLEPGEVAEVRRLLGHCERIRVQGFLEEWRELLAGAAEPALH